ncbi:MAG: ATP-grasp domain-containing protein [Ktedonobacterales bacterium]|nr:ATP-grasp domain-containing protein [Ktedonobacterales bacterium]
MQIVYCADYWHRTQPDAVYAAEAAQATSLGMSVALLDFEALTEMGDAQRGVRAIMPANPPSTALYRGWMLKPADYAALHAALAERGLRLINTPAAYQFTQLLPEYYSALAGLTPRSVWLPLADLSLAAAVALAAATFGDHPIMVKDYVKSRKHEWATACYIPSAADAQAVATVVGNFLRLQGADLSGGLVLRAFVEFAPLVAHPKSGMPLVQEYRLFVLDGQPRMLAPYWDAGDYPVALPPVEPLLAVARQIPSRFFTMDIARTVGGDWLIVELGDGQVAGLPEAADLTQFYAGLCRSLAAE